MATPNVVLKRRLGDSELSYYLPSREDGVSDMYLRLTIKVHPTNFSRQRLLLAWSILQIRHPLLAARVVSNYDSFDPLLGEELTADFWYDVPRTAGEALARTYKHVDIIQTPVRHLLSSYLDGPRVLSDELVCKLILCEQLPGGIPTPNPSDSDSDSNSSFRQPLDLDFEGLRWDAVKEEEKIVGDLILFCCHFIGDAGSIQFITKELVYLLSFPTSELHEVLARDVRVMNASVEACGGNEKHLSSLLPGSMESRLPPINGKLKSTLSKLEFMRYQSRMIGGQTLPKNNTPPSLPAPPPQTVVERPTKTITYELMLSKERTAAVLAYSKKQGVTISTALFALVNYAWAELGLGKTECPTLMYSARNMRPFLPKKKVKSDWKGHESFYYLSLSYFNVVLPSFLPSSSSSSLITPPSTPPPSPPSPTILTATLPSSSSDIKKKIFWHRARLAKSQARPPNPENMMSLVLFVSRTWQMSKARKEGSLKFMLMKKLKAQKEKERPTMLLSSLPSAFRVEGFGSPSPPPPRTPPPPKASNAALLGLSLLGNFDPLFPPPGCSAEHVKGIAPFAPISLGAGCRLKPGGSLLYAYTFDAQLTVVLGYDGGAMGLDEGTMEGFWRKMGEILSEGRGGYFE